MAEDEAVVEDIDGWKFAKSIPLLQWSSPILTTFESIHSKISLLESDLNLFKLYLFEVRSDACIARLFDVDYGDCKIENDNASVDLHDDWKALLISYLNDAKGEANDRCLHHDDFEHNSLQAQHNTRIYFLKNEILQGTCLAFTLIAVSNLTCLWMCVNLTYILFAE